MFTIVDGSFEMFRLSFRQLANHSIQITMKAFVDL